MPQCSINRSNDCSSQDICYCGNLEAQPSISNTFSGNKPKLYVELQDFVLCVIMSMVAVTELLIVTHVPMIVALFCRIEFAPGVKEKKFCRFWGTRWWSYKISGGLEIFGLFGTIQATKADFFYCQHWSSEFWFMYEHGRWYVKLPGWNE